MILKRAEDDHQIDFDQNREKFWVEFVASCAGLEVDSRKESFFRTKDTEDEKCKTKNAFSI